jgi:hypothetical protein
MAPTAKPRPKLTVPASEQDLVLGQRCVDDKSNETTATRSCWIGWP